MEDSFTFDQAVARVRFGETVEVVTELLLGQLTEDERLQLLDGDVAFFEGLKQLYNGVYFKSPYSFGRIERLNIPGAQYLDGPRGINICEATAFPVPMARGATWDPELESRVGEAIGLEGRALGGNLLGTICINLPRHPAWGRVQETYGEDPLLLGEFGVAQIRGLQKNVMACVKHYALNSIEFARFRLNVVIDEDALHEVYLPHFRRCAEEGAAAFMTAYNAVNGEWAGESIALIHDILYQDWGYSGFTITDWVFGMRDGVRSIKAGLTLEAPFQNCRSRTVKQALKSGAITWSQIEQINRRLLSNLVRHYAIRNTEEPQRDVVLSNKHRQLAREVAGRAIVLLKNEPVLGKPLLPLSQMIQRCAVIGRLANSTATGDSCSSMVKCPDVVSSYEGIKQALPKAEVALSDSDSIEAAVELARTSEITILIVGYNDRDEGEFLTSTREDDPEAYAHFPDRPFLVGSEHAKASMPDNRGESGTVKQDDFRTRPRVGDRKSVRLRTEDVHLIEAVSAANPRTVVSIVTAGAVITEEWRQRVCALTISWYNGCEAGTALADVLFGKVNPSGRLPWSMPKDEQHLPYFDPYARQIIYDKWHGQRRLDRMGVEAAYPLGYGLTYTSFEIIEAVVFDSIGQDIHREKLTLRVRVRNTGSTNGRCVVQVYGCPRNLDPTLDFPSRVLVGFQTVEVDPAHSSSIHVAVSMRPLQRWIGNQFVQATPEVEFEVGQFATDPKSLRCVHKPLRAKV